MCARSPSARRRRRCRPWGSWSREAVLPFARSCQPRVVEEALPAALPAEPALLVAAEWRRGVEPVERVGPDDARLELRRHPEDPGALLRPDARAQAIGRVVGLLDRLVHGAEREDREHGSEDLLAGDPVALRDAG